MQESHASVREYPAQPNSTSGESRPPEFRRNFQSRFKAILRSTGGVLLARARSDRIGNSEHQEFGMIRATDDCIKEHRPVHPTGLNFQSTTLTTPTTDSNTNNR